MTLGKNKTLDPIYDVGVHKPNQLSCSGKITYFINETAAAFTVEKYKVSQLCHEKIKLTANMVGTYIFNAYVNSAYCATYKIRVVDVTSIGIAESAPMRWMT